MTPDSPREPEPAQAPAYLAAQGREDRHGEMTGAISVNMAVCGPLVVAWGVFIGPMVTRDTRIVVAVAVVLALALPLLLLRRSQRVWAWLSHWAEKW